MTTPDVSVIIPTHDRPALLRRSLSSALGQAGAAVEVIVIDDGSEPPAEVQPGVVLIRTPNRGASAARNEGLARARGDFILLLDSDDALAPGAVAALLAAARGARSPVAVGRWRNVDAATGAARVAAPAAPHSDALANAVAGGWVAGSFLIARERAARFDERLAVWEVASFLCDSLAAPAKAAVSDAVVVDIAQHDDPGRISVRHDHFEPLATARVFASIKARLRERSVLCPERVVAIDARLMACLHALLSAERPEAEDIHGAIDWPQAHRLPHYRPASFAWCARWGGLVGARGFLAINRALGR